MKLFSHQSTGISDFTSSGGRGAFFWDVGCGKTLAALKSFEELKKENYHYPKKSVEKLLSVNFMKKSKILNPDFYYANTDIF